MRKEDETPFTKGKSLKRLIDICEELAGDLTYSDLATHTSEWVDPVCVDYREVQLCELPPNGQGFVASDGLNSQEREFSAVEEG